MTRIDESKRKRARRGAPPQERVLLHVAYVGDCWEWTAAVSDNGYGRIMVAGRLGYAHRFSYEAFVGPIPDGLHLDHLCRNPPCVRPDHLEPVTPAMNQHRGVGTVAGINAKKRECVKGHPFDEENTHISTTGRRICRICRRAHRQAWADRQRAAAAKAAA